MSIELPPLRPSTYGQATTKSEPQPRTYTAKSVEARERILCDRIEELEAENASLRQHLRVAAGDILRLASTREALTNQLDALRADQDDDNA